MPQSQSHEAIVLATYDVGDADRFCVLLTKDLGKCAARARAVRKPKSQLGGTLLPLKHINIELQKSSSGNYVRDAQLLETTSITSLEGITRAQQGIEILLKTLHDEECVSGIFDVTVDFLRECASDRNVLLPFTLCILAELGLLPEETNTKYFAGFTNVQHAYITLSRMREWSSLPELTAAQKNRFSALCAELLSEIATPLKAGAVVGEIL